MTTQQDIGSDGLRSRVVSGLAWKAGSQILLQLSRFVVALVLARMLSPHDWGLAAMVLVFGGIVVVFTDSALGTALIQRRELREADRSTVFWVSVGIGLALTLGGIGASGALADFYGEADVQPLFVALSVSFLVSALGSTQIALLVRDMRFRSLELTQIAATFAGAVAGIAVAAAGFGAWAIVIQQLTLAAVSTALVWRVANWHPSATFSLASLRRLGRFTGNVFAQNLLFQIGRNLGSLLIGRFLGAAALGAYALASNVILVPFSRIAAPLQQVFFPAFSRMQDDPRRMADVWVRVARLVGALSIPALVGLVVVAPDFVEVVLGERWTEATPVIQILALVGIMQSLQALNGEILLALDRSGTLLWFTILWFTVSIGAVALGLQWGVIGVAACYAGAIIIVEPLNAYVTARALGFPLRNLIRSLSGVVQATVVMGIAVLVLRELLVAQGAPAAARLMLLVPVGVLVYVPCLLWRAPEVTLEVRRVVGGRGKAARAPAETLATARLSEQ